MQLAMFRDGKGNQYQDMYTLSMTDECANRIYTQYFEVKIKHLVINEKYGIRLGNKKATIPYEKELYTFRDGYIFRYEIEYVAFRKAAGINKGNYLHIYRLRNVYQQKEVTIEPMWNIMEQDRVYMDKKAIKALLKNYKRIDKYTFMQRF